jgi:hypothetical protein
MTALPGQDRIDRIVAHPEGLTPIQGSVLRLRHEGLTYSQIADALGLKSRWHAKRIGGTVRRKLARWQCATSRHCLEVSRHLRHAPPTPVFEARGENDPGRGKVAGAHAAVVDWYQAAEGYLRALAELLDED